MKNWFVLSLAVFCLTTAAIADTDPNPFTMPWACTDSPTCTDESGPYSSGLANIGFNYYSTESWKSSCCSLAKSIWQMMCNDGANPQNREVTCR